MKQILKSMDTPTSISLQQWNPRYNPTLNSKVAVISNHWYVGFWSNRHRQTRIQIAPPESCQTTSITTNLYWGFSKSWQMQITTVLDNIIKYICVGWCSTMAHTTGNSRVHWTVSHSRVQDRRWCWKFERSKGWGSQSYRDIKER